MVSKTSILGILLLSLATVLHAGSVPVAQVKPLTDKYTVRSWSVLQGLPENEVRDLVFAPDGYLWLVTPHRLCRFDGVQFDSPLSLPPVTTSNERFHGLRFDRQGVLWVHGMGGAWSHGPSGWEAIVADSPKMPLGCDILKLVEAADGTMWLLTSGGLYAWDGRTIHSYPLPADLSPQVRLADLAIDRQGILWLAAMDRVLRFEQGRYEPSPLPDLPAGNPPAVWHIHTDSAGRIWTATHAELFVWEKGVWRVVPSPEPTSRWVLPGKFWEATDGSLWIAGRESLARLHEERWWRGYQDREMEFPLICRSIAGDSQGNVWVGTDGGLVRLSPRLVHGVPVSPVEIGIRRVSTVTVQKNQELLAGFQGGIIAMGFVWELIQQNGSNGFPFISTTVLLRDSEGWLWIGSQGTYLWRMRGGEIGWVADFGSAIPRAYRTSALRQMADGTFFAGTNDGLMRIVEPHARHKGAPYFAAAGGAKSPVLALHEDRAGNLWVGYESNGLACRTPDEKFQTFHESDGLPGSGVYAIWKDDEGVLWLGGHRGLARWDGNKHWVLPAECGFGGLPVTQIVEDDQKRLWLGTPDGIWGLSRSELAELSAGRRTRLHARRLGVDEGMPSSQCTGSFNYVGIVPPKDRLWFGTAGGLVSFEPKSIFPAGPPPEVRLQSVTVSGREIWRNSLAAVAIPGELTLAPGARQIRIAFTGFHYASPDQLRFSYRLSGPQAGAWSPLSRDRVAQFEYLPAGRHELRVIVCSADGAWNETGLNLVLNVKPWFWQTPWFLGLIVLAFAAAAGLIARAITRRRWKARVEKLKQAEAIQKERTRIARDIHDDLGAGLTQVAFLSELARKENGGIPAVEGRLNQIFQSAKAMTQSVDEIVWAINPANDQAENFVVYLAQFADQFLHAAGISIRLRLPVDASPISLRSAVRHHLFLAIKEALNNVVKHAQATEVQLEISIDERELVVRVNDNGRGLPAQAELSSVGSVAAGHDGLSNLSSRMGEIGGRVERQSVAGQGTKLTFHVPLRQERA